MSEIDNSHANTVKLITLMAECNYIWTLLNKVELFETTTGLQLIEDFKYKVQQLTALPNTADKRQFLGLLNEYRGALITIDDILNRIKEDLTLEHMDLEAIFTDYKEKHIPVIKQIWILGRRKHGLSEKQLHDFLVEIGLLEKKEPVESVDD
jgi:hypothetical protein